MNSTLANLSPDLLPSLERALVVWLPWQRWFAAKHRPIDGIEIVQATQWVDELERDGPCGLLLVVAVRFAGSDDAERYQVPLGVRRTLPQQLESSVIAGVDGFAVYDAISDTELTSVLLRLIGQHATMGTIHFVPERGTGFSGAARRGLHGQPSGAEQSNTSIVFGNRYILKLFRRLIPGVNPDLELHRALRRARSRHIATLLGAVEGELDGAPATLGMLQSFVANSAEGWAMALASVRDLLAAPQLPPEDAGGDFAAEAHRLGNAVAAVHADLAGELGTSRLNSGDLARLSEAMLARLEAALPVVPELAPYAAQLRAAFAAVASTPPGVPVQRVHGDLHLGQVLRAPTNWLLIDFEGEPAAPLAERTARHSPLRDVAGMLRSFDYAAQHQLRAPEQPAARPDPELQLSAQQWTARNRAAFCQGYAEVAGFDPGDRQLLLNAYELEKAVYEAVYETRNRPGWVEIPLRAVRRLTGQGEQ